MSGQPPWWRDAVFYQVYPRSFADADGDGIGDLRGIAAHVDHLVRLGVDAVWLSPFYVSPHADGGYDVADYCAVDPVFGDLPDVDGLVASLHAAGVRLVVDLVPNHTSDEHAWFRAALAAGPGSRERSLYHFRRGRGPGGQEPPNNWPSIFGGSAWSRVAPLTGRDADDDQWYLHSFDPRQPDLNWSAAEVRSRFSDVLRFWLDRGVDGFRVDVAQGLVKAEGLPDLTSRAAGPGSDGAHMLAPTDPGGPMFDQDGVHEVYRAWRTLLEAYPGERVLVGEVVASPPERAALYVREDELHQAFNFSFLHAPWDAPVLRQVISESLAVNGAVGAPTSWVLSNHDTVRHASLLGLAETGRSPNGIGQDDVQPDAALGLRRARAAVMLSMALPGSVYVYQGEELGLPEHTTLPDDVRQDPFWKRSGGTERGRDGCRVPLPWNASRPAFGFSPTGASWLPQPPEWAVLAADVQDGDPSSTLSLYRAAIAVRQGEQLGSGELTWCDGWGAARLAFRTRDVLVVVNLGPDPVDLPLDADTLLRSDDGLEGTPLLSDTAVWLRAPG